MYFEWDERKNHANLRKHGLSFSDAEFVFNSPMIVDLDERYDYGEARWVGIGRLRSRIVVVIYSEPTEETVRIISIRKALRHERRVYEQIFGK